MFQIIVSFPLLILGFIIIFVNSAFAMSLGFILSTTAKNTIISILIGFSYIYFGENLLITFDLEFLAYISYHTEIVQIILHILKTGIFEIKIEGFVSLLVFFAIPVVIAIIAMYSFKGQDIRP
jgi:hypothetical protein